MKKETGWSYFSLALTAFLGLGMEIAVCVVEQILYGVGMDQYNTWQNVLHWIVTCLIWGGFTLYVYRSSKKLGFDYMKQTKKPERVQLIFAVIIVVLAIIEMTISWGGFKPWKELQHQGTLKFIFQYIYYLFETALYLLIIILGQKFGDELFHKHKIPVGGIVLALTWGLVHIATQGLMAGIETVIISVFYGAVYLLLNRNVKWTYCFLALMFLL